MKIVATQQVLDRHIKSADSFTDKNIGSSALPHLKSILIAADPEEGTVVFTAENDKSAIEFNAASGIEILEAGRILVKASDIKIALGTILPDQRVTLTAEGGLLSLDAEGGTHVSLPITPIESGKIALPTVGKISGEVSSVEVKAADFVTAYQVGSVSYDRSGRRPAYKGVQMKVADGGESLRFASSNMQQFSYFSIPLAGAAAVPSTKEKKGGKKKDKAEAAEPALFSAMLDPEIMGSVTSYIKQGETVEVVSNSAGDLAHLLIKTEEGDTLYNVRVSTLPSVATGTSIFQDVMMLNVINAQLSREDWLVADRGETLRLLYAAASMCSLDPEATEGQSKEIMVEVSKDEFNVSIAGKAQFDDTIANQIRTGDEARQFILQWGLNGDAIVSYPGVEQMGVGFVVKAGILVALMLFDAASGWTPGTDEEPSLPPQYMSLVPVKRIEAKGKTK